MGLAGYFRLGVDEVVTTLLLNTVILFLISYLLNGVWRDPVSGWPQSPQIAATAVFPKLVLRSRLHLGFLVAWMVVGVSWLVPPYRWTYDAKALELTRAIAMDAGCLRAKCEQDHDLGYEVMKRFVPILVERLQATRLQILDVYGGGS